MWYVTLPRQNVDIIKDQDIVIYENSHAGAAMHRQGGEPIKFGARLSMHSITEQK